MAQENNINIAEILKDCPQGMELDCTMFEGLEFDNIIDNEFSLIRCRVKNSDGRYNFYNFTKYGCWIDTTFAKCVIFPKGKTTWEGFQRPFKDGDIIYVCDEYSDAKFTYVVILKKIEEGEKIKSHCFYNFEDDYFSTHDFLYDGYNTRFATEKEKETLFKTIKDNGYKWNHETKTLEKLVKPRFKVGDRIRNNQVDLGNIYTIIEVRESSYVVNKNNEHNNYNIDFVLQDDWELVPNKFDINTLKPFDKVLVRCSSLEKWHIDFFEVFNGKNKYSFTCLHNNRYNECIPYEGNEHLLGTTDNCNEYFKTWE